MALGGRASFPEVGERGERCGAVPVGVRAWCVQLSGTTGYTHEHVNWGLTWDDFQEWFPTLVLLVSL